MRFKSLTSILVFLFVWNLGSSQDVWPVQLSGSTIPPRSLDLSVYGVERSQDLTFNAVLTDPVQSSLQVRLQFSVERNGEVIYQTDPNFRGVPITLNQFQNEIIDGSVLAQYIRRENLVSGLGTGIGSTDIPEGFNQICIQLIGVEREVPISNKFCVAGNFKLNQPPQMVKPACGEKLKVQETQNLLEISTSRSTPIN